MAVDFNALVVGPCMAAFGEAVTYTLPGGVAQAVTGVFDRAYLALLPMGGGHGQEPQHFGAAGNVSDRRPVLGVQLGQFTVPPVQGGRVHVPSAGLDFVVKEVRPDGKGHALLLLAKAP